MIESNIITAPEGYSFIRNIDGFNMGKVIHLGIDYSTGVPREDKEEYYSLEEDNINLVED